MAQITDVLFRQLAPTVPAALRAEYVKWFNVYLYEYGITTERRIAAALGRMMVESSNFSRTAENLNYSAKRLMQVWPKRFPTLAKANDYAHNPRKLANYVYGSRLGNRPGTDDGWDLRGGGFNQTTGRDGYKSLGEELGIDLLADPEYLRTPEGAVRSACAEFAKRGCNELADGWQLTAICKRINGGTNGLAEQKANSAKVLALLPDGFVLTKPKLVQPTAISTKVVPSEDDVDDGTPAWIEDHETEPEDVTAAPTPENSSEQPQTAASGTVLGNQTAENIVNAPAVGAQDNKALVEAAKELPDTHVQEKTKTGFLAKVFGTIVAIVTGQITFADFLTKGLSFETIINAIKTLFDVAFQWRYIIGGALFLWFVVNKFESIYLKSKVLNINTDPTKGNAVLNTEPKKPSLWIRIKAIFGK